MSWNPTLLALYPDTLPPGNISTTKYNTSYQKTYNYTNDFTFNNLLTYTNVNVPQYVVYTNPSGSTDPSGSVNSVIVLCGGGDTLSYDPECSDAIRYWKTQGVNIYILLYRLTNLVNTLGTNVLAVSDIYNFNALPFINLYDLNSMFNIVKKQYPSGKIGLHGFSAGGNIVTSYSAIMSYNPEIMTDIVNIVDETIPDSSGNSLLFPSQSFQSFINNYKSGYYTFDSSGSNISFILLMYPYVDQTCPQQVFFLYKF